MQIVKQLLQPHQVRRVRQTIKCLKICLTPSQVHGSLRRPHVDLRWNQVEPRRTLFLILDLQSIATDECFAALLLVVKPPST